MHKNLPAHQISKVATNTTENHFMEDCISQIFTTTDLNAHMSAVSVYLKFEG